MEDGFEHIVPGDSVTPYNFLYDENIAKGGLSDKMLVELFKDYGKL
jgi:hypothetical protein